MEDINRREFVAVSAAAAAIPSVLEAAPANSVAGTLHCTLTINGQPQEIACEPRVTLLDLLRERLHLTGTKKGCDHGQCGACTVLVNGMRVKSCLSLAVAQDGNEIVTIEGLGSEENLHPLQAAFIERDGLQCGFCTSGQICSAVGMLKEWRAGTVSSVTPIASFSGGPVELSDSEIRERMAGNICRCGAYPNIIAAIRDAQVRLEAAG